MGSFLFIDIGAFGTRMKQAQSELVKIVPLGGSNADRLVIPPIEPRTGDRSGGRNGGQTMEQVCMRPLRDELVDLELQLEITAAAGRPSPWVERLRSRVRELRERIDTRP